MQDSTTSSFNSRNIENIIYEHQRKYTIAMQVNLYQRKKVNYNVYSCNRDL